MARDIRPSGNIIGTQIRIIRTERGLSQPELAAKCQRLGWDIGRDIVARIESKIRLVTDSEMVLLCRALNVPLETLFPPSVRKTLPRHESV